MESGFALIVEGKLPNFPLNLMEQDLSIAKIVGEKEEKRDAKKPKK